MINVNVLRFDIVGDKHLHLAIYLHEDGRGDVTYQEYTPAPTEAKPDHTFLHTIKYWDCAVSRPFIPFDSYSEGWIYTIPRAIEKGNAFYDKRLIECSQQKRTIDELNPALVEISEDSQAYGKDVRV